MEKQNFQVTESAPASNGKRSYAKPQLRRFGGLADLTKGNLTGNNDDGKSGKTG